MTDEEWKRYLLNYKKTKLKRIPLDVPIAKYLEIQEAAKRAGESINGYIKEAIRQRIERNDCSNATENKPTRRAD